MTTTPQSEQSKRIAEVLHQVARYEYCLDRHFDGNFSGKTVCDCKVLNEYEAKAQLLALMEWVVGEEPPRRIHVKDAHDGWLSFGNNMDKVRNELRSQQRARIKQLRGE